MSDRQAQLERRVKMALLALLVAKDQLARPETTGRLVRLARREIRELRVEMARRALKDPAAKSALLVRLESEARLGHKALQEILAPLDLKARQAASARRARRGT